MNNDLDTDELMDALRAARPAAATSASDAPDSPAADALLAGILASPGATLRSDSRARRMRVTAGVLSAAAAITVAVVAVNSIGVDNGHVIVQQQPAAADVTAIARASTSAFSSGRAAMSFDAQNRVLDQRGTAQIAFSGNDLDVAIHFDGDGRSPGSDAENKTVGSQFYLLDGAPGAKKWYRDTTASPKGSDIFDLDPRGLLAVLRPSAGFFVVDTTSTPDGEVRHLRATHLGALPSLHLVLGRLDGRDITSLDLWVGANDTVQRLSLTARHTDSAAPACFTQDGVKQCLKPGDKLAKESGRVRIIPGDGTAAPTAPIVTTSSMTVRFTDIGAPVSITAPAGAITVAGKG